MMSYGELKYEVLQCININHRDIPFQKYFESNIHTSFPMTLSFSSCGWTDSVLEKVVLDVEELEGVFPRIK